ncbi:hypothetical protein LXT21_20055 [Myxococcus sp. K38C18041901]|uniref:hypothetical protein n=1 Tax=Myxococcus guangdongensis TaxID=2906760 RepID=UPI0020A81178|nr:hypothetical protein [Myxococcus guangdongensis]MCP3061079.1 hypothetical protein [Myxococcus guangdongensis]
MILRVLALAAFVSIVGCGGAEVPEGTETGALPEQEVSAQAATCESLQNRACNPDREIGCTFANGTLGYCFCQAIPHNKWVCMPN